MIRIFTPREALQHNHVLTAWCECGHRDLDLEALIAAGHGDIEFPELKRRLVCKGCRKHIRSMQLAPWTDPETGLPRYCPQK